MKKYIPLAIIFILLGGHMELTAQSGTNRILVVYFSWSGNAKALAGQIAEATGSNILEVRTVTPYPNNYDDCIKVARQELDNNIRPAITLSGNTANIDQSNTIILCYPNWWGTLPMALFTFLESYNFSGKTIYPLVTHGGSRFGKSLDDLKTLCPRAVIGEGLEVSAFDRNPNDAPRVSVPNRAVTTWLQRIRITS